MTIALANPVQYIASAYKLATALAGVINERRLFAPIQGRKYVKAEGWQAIAIANGCVASARDVEKVADGIRAIGEVRRMADGALVATAEGFLGDDEPTWAKRPMFARRAMALRWSLCVRHARVESLLARVGLGGARVVSGRTTRRRWRRPTNPNNAA